MYTKQMEVYEIVGTEGGYYVSASRPINPPDALVEMYPSSLNDRPEVIVYSFEMIERFTFDKAGRCTSYQKMPWTPSAAARNMLAHRPITGEPVRPIAEPPPVFQKTTPPSVLGEATVFALLTWTSTILFYFFYIR